MTHLPEIKSNLIADQYKANRTKSFKLLVICAIFLLAIAVVSLGLGIFKISINDLLNILLGEASNQEMVVFWNLRLPRIISALTTGAALGLSGAIIQNLLQNPLASPSTLGISQGAAFGAALAIVVFKAGTLNVNSYSSGEVFSILNMYTITLFAFLGSMSASVVILLVSKIRRMNSGSIILAGVALSSLFMSGTIFIQYFASDLELASVVFWTFGDVSRASYREIVFLFIITILTLSYFILNRWSIKAVSLGDEEARTLGVKVERIRFMGILLASLVAAVATAFNGVIAFLGLLAPHIAKKIIGNDQRFVIPFSVLIGAALLLIADTFGRILFASTGLPVGVLTSFMGAPLFLYLLIGRRGDHDRR